MQIAKLSEILSAQPSFRLKQVYKAIFQQGLTNWQDLTVLSKQLRDQLAQDCSLEIQSEVFPDATGQSVKALLTLEDGAKVETVLMRYKNGKNVVCVSCQVGCPMGCAFCATGQMGLNRNLNWGEILEQVVLFNRFLKPENTPVSNVVFMGMGEPFANYAEVKKALETLLSKDGFNIGSRKVSVSTCGLVPQIKQFAQDFPQVKLAISLHAPNDELRNELMPVNGQYALKELFKTLRGYAKKTQRRVMLEYILLAKVNDNPEQAQELADLLFKEMGRLFYVNLISYNSTGKFETPDQARIQKFRQVLEQAGIDVSQRFRLGRKVKGACGQLVTNS